MSLEKFTLLQSLRGVAVPSRNAEWKPLQFNAAIARTLTTVPCRRALFHPRCRVRMSSRQLRVIMFLVPARRMKQIEMLTNLSIIIGGNIFVG